MSTTEYRANLRDEKFILFDMLKVEDVLQRDQFKGFSKDDLNMILDEAAKFAETVVGPVNADGDKEGCRYEKGKVIIPKAFHDVYKKFLENGWMGITVNPEYGGQGLPSFMHTACGEMFTAACTSFTVYTGLTVGAARLIESFGTPELKEKFMKRMYAGDWSGTMCLTEPNAGSAVGDCKSTAKRAGDHFLINGTKMFISGGDQDLTENIIHMVLARIEGAPAGIKGISLFLVPKFRLKPDGSVGDSNDVACGGIEHKIGLNGSSTCLMNFGENGDCHGYLLGVENKGIECMFQMMNEARIGTGLQGVALAAGAYQNALSYTKERIQGVAVETMKDPNAPRVEIIKHPDVRRMLMYQKSYTEATRALLFYTAYHLDLAETAPTKEEHNEHMMIVELLTPICKGFSTDIGFRSIELAIQSMGGYGVTRDYPIEQYLRDVKIASIYEGTNGIQALDLLGRKMSMKGGALFMNFLGIMTELAAKYQDDPDLKDMAGKFAAGKDKLSEVAMHLAGLGMSGDRLYPVANASPLMVIFGNVVCSYLLLWEAAVAIEKLGKKGLKLDAAKAKTKDDPEVAYLVGKVLTAQFFINNILPQNVGIAECIMSGDHSVLEIAEECF